MKTRPYPLLQDHSDSYNFQSKCNELLAVGMKEVWDKHNVKEEFVLQPIEDIHLYSNLGGELEPDDKGDGIGDIYYTKAGVLDKFPIGFFTSPPNKPSNPSPADLKENVGLEITLEVTVSDPDGDELTAYFYRGDTNTLIKPDAIVKNIKSGEKASFTFVQGFDTAFTWYVIINDSIV